MDYHKKGVYCIWSKREFWLAHYFLRQFQHKLDKFGSMQRGHLDYAIYILGHSVEVWTSIGKLKMAQFKWDKQNIVLVNIQ